MFSIDLIYGEFQLQHGDRWTFSWERRLRHERLVLPRSALQGRLGAERSTRKPSPTDSASTSAVSCSYRTHQFRLPPSWSGKTLRGEISAYETYSDGRFILGGVYL